MSSENLSDSYLSLKILIDPIATAMITTVRLDGKLESRPMTTQSMDTTGSLWFFTSRRSPWIRLMTGSCPVHVAYVDIGNQLYISVSGDATPVNDREQCRTRWTPMLFAWFPGGFDDPDIQLVRIQIEHADYWRSRDHIVTHLIDFPGYRSSPTMAI